MKCQCCGELDAEYILISDREMQALCPKCAERMMEVGDEKEDHQARQEEMRK